MRCSLLQALVEVVVGGDEVVVVAQEPLQALLLMCFVAGKESLVLWVHLVALVNHPCLPRQLGA
jgi:hypothetical protein